MAALHPRNAATGVEEADAEANASLPRSKVEEFDRAIVAIVDIASKRQDRYSIENAVRSQLNQLVETEEKALASFYSRRERTSKARLEDQIRHNQQVTRKKEERLREEAQCAKARSSHFANSVYQKGMEAFIFLVFRLWRSFAESSQQKALCDRLKQQVQDGAIAKANAKTSKRQASRENEPPKNGACVTATPQANCRRQNPQRSDRQVLQEPGEMPTATHTTASAPDLFPPSVQAAMLARARAHSASCLPDSGGLPMPPPLAAPLLAAPKSPCFGEDLLTDTERRVSAPLMGRVAVNPPAWTGNSWTVTGPLAGCKGGEGRLSRGSSSGGGSACASVGGNMNGQCCIAPPSRGQRATIEAQASANALPGSPPLPPRLAEWQISADGMMRVCGSGAQRAHSASGRSLSPGPRGPSYSNTSPAAPSPRNGVASPRPGGTSPRQGSGINSPRFQQPLHATSTGSAIAAEHRGWENGCSASFPGDRARDDPFCGRRFFSGSNPQQQSVPHTPPMSTWEVAPPPASPLPASRPERGTLPKTMTSGQGSQANSNVSGTRPRSPRNSPLHSRPVRHGNTAQNTQMQQPVIRRNTGNSNAGSATSGPLKSSLAQTQGTASSTGAQGMSHGVTPHRDSRGLVGGMPAQGASFVAPPSMTQSSGSFVATAPQGTSTGSFVAAPQSQTQAAVRRGGQTQPMAPPYACVIRRAPC